MRRGQEKSVVTELYLSEEQLFVGRPAHERVSCSAAADRTEKLGARVIFDLRLNVNRAKPKDAAVSSEFDLRAEDALVVSIGNVQNGDG